jgi:hypothetical protein
MITRGEYYLDKFQKQIVIDKKRLTLDKESCFFITSISGW